VIGKPAARLDHPVEEAAVGPARSKRYPPKIPCRSGQAFHKAGAGASDSVRERATARRKSSRPRAFEPLEGGPISPSRAGASRANSSETNVRSTSARRVNSLEELSVTRVARFRKTFRSRKRDKTNFVKRPAPNGPIPL